MSKIAIITARGGSKRIPKKNIRDFCGKPIIVYSIEAAIKSGLFDEVMVSTDSEEIKEIAVKYGASVPFMRSESTSNDYATTADVIREVIAEYENLGKNFDTICCIYPTAPFVTADKLKAAMSELDEKDGDSLMPVVPFGFPPQRAVVISQGHVSYKYPEYAMKRSQDLERLYHDCGQFYICRTEVFKRSGSLLAGRTVAMVMREEEVQDIDNESDWAIAVAKYKAFRPGEHK